MKKSELIQRKINLAWKRTVVFLKLIKHKHYNGNLIGPYDPYVFAIVAHFRKTENALLQENKQDNRGGDRRSKNYSKKEPVRLFDSFEYDEDLRLIIKKIENQYTNNN